MSLRLVLGHLCSIRSKALYVEVVQRLNTMCWYCTGVLSQPSRDCLQFWVSRLQTVTPRFLKTPTRPQYIGYSDASATRGGAFVSCATEVAHLMWSASERTKSSTWRELRMLDYSLEAFGPSLCGGTITWHTDNQAITFIVYKGSMKADIQNLAISIF